jgi:O-antigen/teichoic acid export membrane protein
LEASHAIVEESDIASMSIRLVRAVKSLTSARNRGGLVLFASMTAVNVSNLIFQLIVVRKLTPDAYGALGALTGLLFIFTVPAASLQVVITRAVASRRKGLKEGDEPMPIVAGPLLLKAVAFGLVGSIALTALSPLLSDFLHLPSVTAAVLLAVFVVPSAIDLIPRAVLLGEEHFIRVSAALVGGALVRLVSGIVLTGDRGLNGAMAANVLGALVTAGLLLPGIKNFVNNHPGVEPIRIRLSEATPAFIAFSGYWALTGVQPFLARHLLDRDDSGFFAAANTLASMALFLPGAIAMVAFPRFAQADSGLDGRRVLVRTLGLTAVLSIGAACVLSIAPHLITKGLFGEAYASSGPVLGLLAFSAGCMGLTALLMQFHLARHSSVAASMSWFGVAFYAVAAFLFHDTLTQIATVAFLSTVIVLVLMAGIAFIGTRPAISEVEDDQWRDSEPTLDLSIVVPYFNAGQLLRKNIDGLVELLDQEDLTYEIIAVSDGSTDGSEKSLHDLSNDRVKTVVLSKNQGKGQALRVGLTMGQGKYLGFIDADGDIDVKALHEFLLLIKLYEPDIILGSKRHPMSTVHYPVLRRVYSWGYQQGCRILFRLNVRDTQTGLKLVRRDALVQVLPRMVEKRFAFDLELFVVARLLGYRRFFEAPVVITHQFTSTVSWRSVRGTLLDTLAIFYRLHFLRYYDEPRRTKAELSPSAPSPTPPAGSETAARPATLK